jgi:hypothetical protein
MDDDTDLMYRSQKLITLIPRITNPIPVEHTHTHTHTYFSGITQCRAYKCRARTGLGWKDNKFLWDYY